MLKRKNVVLGTKKQYTIGHNYEKNLDYIKDKRCLKEIETLLNKLESVNHKLFNDLAFMRALEDFYRNVARGACGNGIASLRTKMAESCGS